MKPVMYLDVDGCLNLIPQDQEIAPECDWDDITLHPVHSGTLASTPAAAVGPFPMWFSKKMAAELMALDVEIRWLTTWADEANTVLAPLLGFPGDYSVAARPGWGSKPWKFFHIQDSVKAEGRPFIWIDDVIYSDEREWAENCGVPALVLRPDPATGITPYMIESIRQFLARQAATA